jgi:hypothetical protein
MNSVFIHLSTTATDIVQFGARSSVFRDERVLVGGWRLVVFTGRWPFLLGRRKRRVVTSEPSARAFDCAAVWPGGQSPLRAHTERQYCESNFHLIFLWTARWPPHNRVQPQSWPRSARNRPPARESARCTGPLPPRFSFLANQLALRLWRDPVRR